MKNSSSHSVNQISSSLEVNPMNRLFQFLNSYRKELWTASIASVINKVFDLMPPVLTAWFIDSVSGNIPQWIPDIFGWETVPQVIVFLLFLTVFIFLGESFFEWIFQRGFMRLAQNTQHDLRVDVYAHLQHREIAYFENNRVGNLMTMLNDDINQLERFLNDSFNTILQLIVLFIFAGITLCYVSLPLGLIGMIPIPFILFGSFFYQKKIAPYYKEVREEVGQLGARLENNISGIKVIKSFTAESFEKERVQEASAKYREANFKAIRWNSVYVPIIRMVIAIGFVSTLGLGAYWVHEGTSGLTIGALAFFAMMIQRLLWPVTRLGHVFNEYERARASARRVFGLLDSENKIIDGETKEVSTMGKIVFEKLSFAYPNSSLILENFNLNIPNGSSLGIVGLTGAGKTTLIKLLMRYYDPKSGAILLNNKNIQDYRKKALRQHIALVSQDIYLFHGTIRDNIAYGMDDKSQAEITEAAKRAEIHEFIISLKVGYDAQIGERGIDLSGGQRQRLSLARALLKAAPILILDEATSSVDMETEKAIQTNLKKVMREKTTIVVAHRLSTIRNADNIIVLGKNRILEQGTHEELLKRSGHYSELWGVQLGTF